MEPEAIRSKCWFGRSCPLQMADLHPEVLTAYEFGMMAISRFEHEKGDRAGEVEFSTSREAIQFACWARGLKSRDRVRAIELVNAVVKGCQLGADWEVSRQIAQSRIGTPHEQPTDRLVADVDLEGGDG